jgi:hypothetical protein
MAQSKDTSIVHMPPRRLIMIVMKCDFCDSTKEIKLLGLDDGDHPSGYGWISCDDCFHKANEIYQTYKNTIKYDYFIGLQEAKTKIRVKRSSGEIDNDWTVKVSIETSKCPSKIMIWVENKRQHIEKTVYLENFLELNPEYAKDFK